MGAYKQISVWSFEKDCFSQAGYASVGGAPEAYGSPRVCLCVCLHAPGPSKISKVKVLCNKKTQLYCSLRFCFVF